ncbi:MAG: chemotaxis protein CheD [Fusobacteriia bacterium 4572_132]|nr:MAG: chemotaxis protein CheD [Fusobacteriia bacterium 4572_132]
MNTSIKIGIADYKISKAPDRLMTLGLGSCVGITMYDRIKKVGGLAHIMLPKNNNPEKRSSKFADNAIEDMLGELLKIGVKTRNIETKIVGGAQMFSFAGANNKKSVGHRNVVAVKKILMELKLKIKIEDVGGTFGRTIELNLENGELMVKTIGHGEKMI